MYHIWLVLLYCVFRYSNAEVDSFCVSRWHAYSNCMRIEYGKNTITGLPVPNDTVSWNFQISSIRSCFKENNCKDPILPEAASRARGMCYPKTSKAVRQDLEACAKKTVSNFFLPNDEYSEANGTVYSVMFLQTITAMKDLEAYCPSDTNLETITTCLKNKWSSSSQPPPPAPTGLSHCEMVSRCKTLSSMTDECDSKWNDLLCPCVSDARSPITMSKYQVQYTTCMRSVGVTVDKNNETAFKWIDASLSGMCSSESAGWMPGNKMCADTASTPEADTTSEATTTIETETEGSATVTEGSLPTLETTTLMGNTIPTDQVENTIPTGQGVTTIPTDQVLNTIPTDQTVNTIPTDQVQVSTVSEEITTQFPVPDDDATRQYTFFGVDTVATQGEETEASSTTPEATTTAGPNWWPKQLKDLGIDNPLSGWEEVLKSFGLNDTRFGNMFGNGK